MLAILLLVVRVGCLLGLVVLWVLVWLGLARILSGMSSIELVCFLELLVGWGWCIVLLVDLGFGFVLVGVLL